MIVSVSWSDILRPRPCSYIISYKLCVDTVSVDTVSVDTVSVDTVSVNREQTASGYGQREVLVPY